MLILALGRTHPDLMGRKAAFEIADLATVWAIGAATANCRAAQDVLLRPSNGERLRDQQGRMDCDRIGPLSQWQGDIVAVLMAVAQDFAAEDDARDAPNAGQHPDRLTALAGPLKTGCSAGARCGA